MTHWADKTAERILKLQTGEDLTAPTKAVLTAGGRHPLTCASGISPSGPVHVGNLRDIVTIWFVGKALKERGVFVRLIHSWDNYDRFRKVPANTPANFTEFIGRPLSKVPDPFNCCPSYAAHYEKQFETSLLEMGIEIEFLNQTKLYESGLYCDAILEAVSSRHAIYDILQKFRTQAGSPEERENYYPITLYCEHCGKDTTSVSAGSSEGIIAYHCTECQHDGEQNLKNARNIKLLWKVDWAMRWRHEKVVFEPGGKDHATAGGSFEVSSEIAKEIFHYRPPIFQPYEFIGLKGLTGKMSGSSGILLTPGDALKIYQPEVLLSVFSRMPPNKAFDIVLDEGIYRVYDEFDRANAKTPIEREIALSRIPGRDLHAVAFKQLAGFAGIVQGNHEALELIFDRMGTPCKSELFEERLQKAENWLSEYAPEQRLVLREKRDDDYFKALTLTQKTWVLSLYDFLVAKQRNLEEATHEVYEIPKKDQPPDTDLTLLQRDFFKIIYHLLFGKEKGPRLGTFFAAVPKEQYLSLLEFRTG